MIAPHRAVPFLAGSALALSMLTIMAAPAQAAPKVDGEFAVSSVGTNNQIAQGPDGNLWVTLDSATNDLARITPAGVVTEYNNAALVNTPTGITAAEGSLWVTQNGGVVKIDPANPTAGAATAIAAIADPRIIVRGPDGNLWTASADKVIKIPPSNPAGFTAYNTTGVQGARAIAAASDGTLWVADFGGQQLVNVTTAGVGTKYATGGGPQGVWGGPDKQIAYGDPGTNPQTVGRLVPAGTAQKTQTPNRDPFGVTFGTDGAYWIAQFANNKVGRLTPQGAYTELGGFTGNAGPRQITTGPNNTLWVTLDGTDKIGRITGVTAPAPTPKAPVTTITKAPKDEIRAGAGRVTVRFRFKSNLAGSTFTCRLVKKRQPGAKWRSCTSPTTYKVGKGSFTFHVRAKANGVKDPTPATDTFRVVKRKRR